MRPTPALMAVAVDLLNQAGLKADDVTVDFGTLVQRRMNKAAPGKGGWNVLVALFSGSDLNTPASNFLLRGNGQDAWFGWPDAPALETLRERWLDATTEADQKQIAQAIQARAFIDLPYVPLGQFFYQTAYRSNITNDRGGMVLPLNAVRA